jgi:hypothetical protein
MADEGIANRPSMAPFFTTLISRDFDPSQVADEFRAQWIQPGDVFSVLLILGGDAVARALAQVAGSGLSTVTFSFGMPSLPSADVPRVWITC